MDNLEHTERNLKGLFFMVLTEFIPAEEVRKSLKDKVISGYLKEIEIDFRDQIAKEVKLSRELDRKLWMDVVIENAKINNHPEVVANNVLKHFKDKF